MNFLIDLLIEGEWKGWSMTGLNNYEKGRQQEQFAEEYLKQKGYQILAENYQCYCGEIDLVARHHTYLVFIEVKSRTMLHNGYPQEAVTKRKQQRIYRSAQYYMEEFSIPASTPCRFDVVSILGTQIRIIQNAFGGIA